MANIAKMEKYHTPGIPVTNLVVAIVLISIFAFIVFNKASATDAKVRAVEVSQQAGQWNKLQVAYAIHNEKLGSFTQIGYVPPGTLAKDGESSKSRSFSYSSDLETGIGRFLAINIVSLEKCKKHKGRWGAYGNPDQIMGNAVAIPPEVPECAALTPDFELLKEF
jgi:hypothetical protein